MELVCSLDHVLHLRCARNKVLWLFQPLRWSTFRPILDVLKFFGSNTPSRTLSWKWKGPPIYCDITSAISIAKNPMFHSRTKDIEIKYHFIREHVQGGIDIQDIPTDQQFGDIFIKPLAIERYKELRNDSGICPTLLKGECSPLLYPLPCMLYLIFLTRQRGRVICVILGGVNIYVGGPYETCHLLNLV